MANPPSPPPGKDRREVGGRPESDSGSLFTFRADGQVIGSGLTAHRAGPSRCTCSPLAPENWLFHTRQGRCGPTSAAEAGTVVATVYRRDSGQTGAGPLRPCALPAAPLPASGPRGPRLGPRKEPAPGPAQGALGAQGASRGQPDPAPKGPHEHRSRTWGRRSLSLPHLPPPATGHSQEKSEERLKHCPSFQKVPAPSLILKDLCQHKLFSI